MDHGLRSHRNPALGEGGSNWRREPTRRCHCPGRHGKCLCGSARLLFGWAPLRHPCLRPQRQLPLAPRLWKDGRFSEPRVIATDSNTGNVYVKERSNQIDFSTFDYVTLAYDSNGHQLWQGDYSGGSADSIAVDSSTGNVYVTGQSQGDYATVAYDSGGHQLWAARHSTGTANAIAVDSNTGN